MENQFSDVPTARVDAKGQVFLDLFIVIVK